MRKLYAPACAGILLGVAVSVPLAFAQTPGEIIAYAGNGIEGYSGAGGPATSAEIYRPEGIVFDKAGNLYIADQGANCIWKVAAQTGIITAAVGQCPTGIGYGGDGGQAANAQMNGPRGIAFNSAGDMYISDTNNQRIRKVSAATGIITTVAGNGDPLDSGDGGPAISAALSYPEFIAVDPSGNLYISDDSNNVIRKVDAATGIISTVVGNGTSGYSGDGKPAIEAQLYSPFGLTFDSSGNLYIADQGGNAIRKVAASTGTISTVAGNGVAGYCGDGGPAKNACFNSVQDISFDRLGNLYLADQQNSRIRKITTSSQIVTTAAGASYGNTSGIGGPALEAVLVLPYGVAVDSSENVYLSEVAGSQVLKVIAGGLAQSTVNLTAPGLNILAGHPFELTAQVTGPLNSPTPTGTVTFYSLSTKLAQVPLNASGVATYPLDLTTLGYYDYSATYSGDKNYYPSVGATVELNAVPKQAAPPSFDHASGTYAYNLQVAIHNGTPNLTIFYTTDGSTPSYTHGTIYQGAVPITANTTIKAIAVDMTPSRQYADSSVTSATYVINLAQEDPPTNGEWIWMSGGHASANQSGSCLYTSGDFGDYGMLGVPGPDNVPGARAPGAHWTDNKGNFWIFGGPTATPDDCNDTNDLWMFNTTTKEWTWMSGNNTYSYPPPAGVYGTMGKFAPGNVPGGRDSAVSWTDNSGNLWLFGGEGFDSTGKPGSFNDLWEFDPATREWAWMGGSNTLNQGGSYGTLHVAQNGNTPGSRWGASGWADQSGNFWLFGGCAYDSAGNQGDINDLWKFNVATRQWAWMGGAHLIDQHGVYGIHDQASPTNIPGARDSGMAWVDALGKFWFFGGEGLGATNTYGMFNDLWEFNPSDLNWTWASGSAYGGTYGPASDPGQGGVYDQLGLPDPGNTPGSRIASATFTDGSGNLWLLGGSGYDSAGNYGDLDDLWEFDRSKWLWAWMGGHEIVPGLTSSVTYGPYRDPSPLTQPGARSGAAGFTDKSGNLWLFGGENSPAVPGVNLLNDLLEYQFQ